MPATKEYCDALGVGETGGALAAQVFIDSPAQKGGMKPGDYIVEIDGSVVKDVEHVQREVGRIPAGKVVQFTVIRNEKKVNISVKIEERSDKISSDNGKLWPGFIAAPITDEIRQELELEKKVNGVAVTNVLPKSPAASLRLQTGDVITAVNGKPVKDLKSFYAEIALVEKSVNFDIYSNGGTITTGTYKF